MVWDLPTRLFHWGFVISIVGSYISGERGALEAHELFGLAACGFGVSPDLGLRRSETARSKISCAARKSSCLSQSLYRPHRSLQPGHNPLGAISVITLTLMAAMSVTGLWTGDDIL